MSALVVVPPPMKSSLPLYQIEETLATFADTATVVPPEQEKEFLQEFAAILTQAVEKRDRIGQFMAHLEAQIDWPRTKSGAWGTARPHTSVRSPSVKST
jgi:hypothetical protein